MERGKILMRDYQRSPMTNKVYELLENVNGVKVYLEFPYAGTMCIKEEALREFLWIIRSHKVEMLLPDYIIRMKNQLRSAEPTGEVSNGQD